MAYIDEFNDKVKTALNDLKPGQTMLTAVYNTKDSGNMSIRFNTQYSLDHLTVRQRMLINARKSAPNSNGSAGNRPAFFFTGFATDLKAMFPEAVPAIEELESNKSVDRVFVGSLNPKFDGTRIFVTAWDSLIPDEYMYENKDVSAKAETDATGAITGYYTHNGCLIYRHTSIDDRMSIESLSHDAETVKDVNDAKSFRPNQTDADVALFLATGNAPAAVTEETATA
jgi:hypothetical protein